MYIVIGLIIHFPSPAPLFTLFLHTPQVVTKLLELYLELHELGHPDYLTGGKVNSVPCSMPKEGMNNEVQRTQLLITEWNHEVSELQARYTWLLYFSVPKMLLLYHLICSSGIEGENVDKIVHEVSILMINEPTEREKLMEGTLVSGERSVTAIAVHVTFFPLESTSRNSNGVHQFHFTTYASGWAVPEHIV